MRTNMRTKIQKLRPWQHLFHSRRPKGPLFFFCYHKCGTVLLSKTLRRICDRFGWRFVQTYGRCESLPSKYDVVLFSHSETTPEIMRKMYKGIHVIRDPRDVIVSGYLYHSRCNEPWCINTDLEPSGEVDFPKVPFIKSTATREEIESYLKFLSNKSYQENLKARDFDEGFIFEMEGYSGWTIKSMAEWDYTNADVLELKFEDMLANYDQTFSDIFDWLDLTQKQQTIALELASLEDYSKMSNEQKKANPHISSTRISKWAGYFKDVHKEKFQELFGTVLVKLGYEKDNNW